LGRPLGVVFCAPMGVEPVYEQAARDCDNCGWRNYHADALERRLLGELSHELSHDLGEPESTSHDRGDVTMRPGTSAT